MHVGAEDLAMGEAMLVAPVGREVPLYDEKGELVGVIAAPTERDPIGAGRATVYLVRAANGLHAEAAA